MSEDEMILIECFIDKEKLQEWQQKAQEYKVSISYYIAEFV